MAFAFDTLGYATKLEAGGIAQKQARAHAEAAREFVMAELVTKHDMEQALKVQKYELTFVLGSMFVVGVAFLGFLIKL
jgi:hypothetical protein